MPKRQVISSFFATKNEKLHQDTVAHCQISIHENHRRRVMHGMTGREQSLLMVGARQLNKFNKVIH